IEARRNFTVRGQVGVQDFESDRALESEMVRTEHRRHPPDAQKRVDAIAVRDDLAHQIAKVLVEFRESATHCSWFVRIAVALPRSNVRRHFALRGLRGSFAPRSLAGP